MLDQNDLQAIANLIKNEVEPIKQDISELKSNVAKIETRLDRIEEDIATIKEDSEITREVTNKLGEWVDFYFHDDKPYPLDEDEIERYKERMGIKN